MFVSPPPMYSATSFALGIIPVLYIVWEKKAFIFIVLRKYKEERRILALKY